MKGNLALLTIALLLTSAITVAEPVLVFSPNQAHLLIGVDDVSLNGESYDVRFGTGSATIFRDQESATAASVALVDQVFSSATFQALNIATHTVEDWGTWLGGSVSERGQWLRVAQFWGERLDACQIGAPYWCDPKMNQSVIALSPTHEPSTIFNSDGIAGFLSRCGDCGFMETQWIKRSVMEPSGLALLIISLAGLAMRRRLQSR